MGFESVHVVLDAARAAHIPGADSQPLAHARDTGLTSMCALRRRRLRPVRHRLPVGPKGGALRLALRARLAVPNGWLVAQCVRGSSLSLETAPAISRRWLLCAGLRQAQGGRGDRDQLGERRGGFIIHVSPRGKECFPQPGAATSSTTHAPPRCSLVRTRPMPNDRALSHRRSRRTRSLSLLRSGQ